MTPNCEARVTLSICMTTRNRAHLIGRALESILAQLTDSCELVVVDGGSTDDTEVVLRGYEQQFKRLKYVRAEVNGGIDADYDKAVMAACGEYCWMASDDDIFKPRAVEFMLSTLQWGWSVVITNAEVIDSRTGRPLERTFHRISEDRAYKPSDIDIFFEDVWMAIIYIGLVVIRRSVWLARNRTRFYGSFFVHIGVIFQQPLPGEAKVLVTPLIEHMQGSERSFSANLAEIYYCCLPKLISSLPLSSALKKRLARPLRSTSMALIMRACGVFSVKDYRRWVRSELVFLERLPYAIVVRLPIGPLRLAMILYASMFHPNSSALVWLKNGRI